MALYSYHDAQGSFPPAYLTYSSAIMGYPSANSQIAPYGDTGPGWAALALLLPHTEQSNLYDAMNRDVPCWDPTNATVVREQISLYLCPSAFNQTGTYPVQDGPVSAMVDPSYTRPPNTLATFASANTRPVLARSIAGKKWETCRCLLTPHSIHQTKMAIRPASPMVPSFATATHKSRTSPTEL